jgi:phage baseplate assembly protein W
MAIPIPNIISWPLEGVDKDGRFTFVEGDASVRDVIRNILLTRPGERRMRPEFGAGLQDFIHQPNNETTRSLMSGIIRKSIEQWEPRVEVEDVDVEQALSGVAAVHVTNRYRMRHSRTPAEFTLSLGLAGAGAR